MVSLPCSALPPNLFPQSSVGSASRNCLPTKQLLQPLPAILANCQPIPIPSCTQFEQQTSNPELGCGLGREALQGLQNFEPSSLIGRLASSLSLPAQFCSQN